jgi:hypothetical protein
MQMIRYNQTLERRQMNLNFKFVFGARNIFLRRSSFGGGSRWSRLISIYHFIEKYLEVDEGRAGEVEQEAEVIND